MIIFLTATSCPSKKKHETLYVLVYFKVFYVIRVSHWLTAVHEKDSFFFKREPFILSRDRVTGPAESFHSHPVQSDEGCGSLLSRGGDAGWESSLSCRSWGAFALVLIVPDRSLSNPAQLWQAVSLGGSPWRNWNQQSSKERQQIQHWLFHFALNIKVREQCVEGASVCIVSLF